MIFAAVGTQKFQLNRLLKALDRLIAQGGLEEEVFAQTGHSDYRPEHYRSQAFLSKEEFEEKIRESDLVIAHSGAGTIISALKAGRPVIVFPRRQQYGEHVDDHQLEIAEAFAQKNYVTACLDEAELGAKIAESRHHVYDPYVSHRADVVACITDYLSHLEKSPRK